MKVSALVSAYYAGQYLPGRIENLLEQKPEPEILVVCQKQSIEERIAKYYGVKTILTDDIPTIGAAWNIAIKQAQGDYCVIANTDDRFMKGGLKELSDVLDTHKDVGYVFSDLYLVKDKITKPRNNHGHLPAPGRIPNAYTMLKQRYFCGPMPMWRRTLHEQHGYFDESYIVACDYDWVLRLAEAGVGIYWLDRKVGLYEIRGDSLEWRNAELCKIESRKIRGAA